ncbi:MAG TPA: hypothetical protein DCS48_02260 [Desulfovibrio sp.]|nr:hypothetical protein [Desulfovibrio sp.]
MMYFIFGPLLCGPPMLAKGRKLFQLANNVARMLITDYRHIYSRSRSVDQKILGWQKISITSAERIT